MTTLGLQTARLLIVSKTTQVLLYHVRRYSAKKQCLIAPKKPKSHKTPARSYGSAPRTASAVRLDSAEGIVMTWMTKTSPGLPSQCRQRGSAGNETDWDAPLRVWRNAMRSAFSSAVNPS